jgi:prepilin-type N-terminal cleavage/methylation domain-containing protein
MELRLRRKRTARKQNGMSLVELMIAMVVLLVGLVGSLALVATSVGNNKRSRLQGNSTIVAQLVTEKISSVRATLSPVLQISDCSNAAPQNVNTAPGGSPINAQGDIDFTLPPVAGYQLLYTDCGTAGRQFIYDVRWNVQQPTANVKLLVVTAQKANVNVGNRWDLKYVSFPVTIRTLIGQGT